MATRIRVKRGTSSQITGYTGPHYVGELAYATDTEAFYVSNGTTFVAVGGSSETPTLQSVTDAGNTTTNSIGIGTTNPSAYYSNKLVVGAPDENGITLAATTTSAVNHIMFADGTTGSETYRGYLSYNHLEDSMRFGAGSFERMRITLTGNVGIGTTAPSEKLEVVGYAKASTGFKIGNYNLINSGGDGLNINSSAYYPLRFLTNNAERMRISEAGNVSIGTTAPVEKVHINGNLRIGLIGNTGYYISWGQNEVGSTGDFARIQGIRTSGAGNQAGHLTFQTKPPLSGNSPTERLRITDTGNVGIGTTSPSHKLQIVDSNASEFIPLRITTAQNLNYILLNNISGANHYVQTNARGLSLSADENGTLGTISLKTNNVTALRVDSSQNIGIGTTAPADKLTVSAGNILIDDGRRIKWATGSYIETSADASLMTFRAPFGNYYFNGGNVGIGTSVPAQPLHVATNNNNTTLALRVSNDHTGGRAGISFNLPNITNEYYSVGVDNDRYFKISNGNNLATNTRMVISPAGNVGIGTTAPASDLSVSGRADISSRLRVGAAGNPNKTLEVWGDQIFATSGGAVWATFDQSEEKVGIGTTSPAEKLEVAGNIKTTSGNLFNYNANTIGEIRGNANTYNNFDLVYGASWDGSNWIDTLGAYQSHKLTIGTGGMMFSTGSGQAGGYPVSYTERFRISNTGNVGIGTTAPAEKLEVAGNIKLRTGDYLKSATRTNILLDRPTDARMVFNTLYQGSTTGGYDFTTGSTSRMLITGDGNVGIGATAPATILHLRGDSPTLRIEADGANESSIIELVQDGGITGAAIKYNGASNIEALQFNTGVSDVRMTIKRTNGNVGIGTTAPTEKLHVNGGIKVNGNIQLDGNSRIVQTIDDTDLILGSNNTGRVWVKNTGDVGIGTNTPAAKLHVQGIGYTNSGLLSVQGYHSSYYATAEFKNTTDQPAFIDVVGGASVVSGAGWVSGIRIKQSDIADTPQAYMMLGSNSRLGAPTLGGLNAFHIVSHRAGAGSYLPIALWTGNSPRIIIDTAGNVGIGTTAPAVSLDVDGQVHLGPQSTTGFPSIDIASNGRTTIRGSAPALSVRDQNNNGGYIDMGGGTLANINSITSSAQLSFSSTNVRFGGDIGSRVNIVGQDSSSQRVLGLKQGSSGSSIMIDIRNSSNVSTMGITSEGGFYFVDSNLVSRYRFDHDYSPSPADGLTTGFEFRTENKNGVLTTFGYIDVTNDDRTLQESSMRFSVGETTPTEIMRLQSDGNVGIGTTAPAAPLHVNGSLIAGASTTSGLYFNTAADRLHISNQRVLEKSGASLFLGYNTNQLIFRTNNLERARFDVNGNLGIGTTTPAAKLHVSTTSGTAFKVNPNDTNREWYIDTTNPDHLKKGQNLILHADPTGVHTSTFISFNIDGSNKMHIQHDGAVGIGTTSPTSNLNINGSAMRQLRLQTSGGPSSNTDTAGNVGDIAYDDLYFYIKTTNGWGRVPLDFGF